MNYRLLFLLVPQLIVDSLSCYLNLRKNRRGSGASGVPVVSVLLSLLVIWGVGLRDKFRVFRMTDALVVSLVAVLVHALLVFLIPGMVRQRANH